MSAVRFLAAAIGILLFVLGTVEAGAAATNERAGLIERYRDRLSALRYSRVHVRQVEESTARGGALQTRVLTSECLRSGERVFARFTRWVGVSDPMAPADAEFRETSSYWCADGRTYTLRKLLADGIEVMSVSPQVPEHQIGAWQDPILSGYIPSDAGRIDSVLEGAACKVRPRTELVDGMKCVVVDAETDDASYSVWFAVEHGCCIVQLIKKHKPVGIERRYRSAMRQRERDATGPDPELLRDVVGISHVLSNVRLAKYGEVWVPISGTYQEEVDYRSYPTSRSVRSIDRHLVELNPTVSDDDFEPKVLEGTRVHFNDGTGLPHIWREGKIVPYEDPEVTARLTQLALEFKRPEQNDMGAHRWLLGPSVLVVSCIAVWALIWAREYKRLRPQR